MNLDYLKRKCWSLSNIYQTATEDEHFAFEASRLAHIRAICSPYFLGVFSVGQCLQVREALDRS